MLAFKPEPLARRSASLDEAGVETPRAAVDGMRSIEASKPRPLLRIPPFPGARARAFAQPSAEPFPMADAEVEALIAAMRSQKVGGDYWGSQPPLPEVPYVLVHAADFDGAAELMGGARVLRWLDRPSGLPSLHAHTVTGACDPWHLLGGASLVIADADDELVLLACIAGVPVQCIGTGAFQALAGEPAASTLREAFRTHVIDAFSYVDPYSGEPISFAQALQCCAFWRRLIDSNRDIDGAVGFAFWKRATVAPLLWRGSDEVPFLSDGRTVRKGQRIAIWKARTPPAVISHLEARDVQLIEVEDGFIRSVGLGADCVPPLSIVVDRAGVHFDPNQPSELEDLLQNGAFSPDILDGARKLRALIVESGVSKYGSGRAPLDRRDVARRHILVPGQVEDDRAVVSGGAGLTSNLELLRRVRAQAPDAYLLYKPHPDVEAGHRTGAIPDELCLSLADEIVRDEPISALLDLVDEVHVNSSLAGFEALLRGKAVTTHGVPFYAGWGLTRDLGPVPARRTAKRTLDELVAAVLLLYPRYLDPVTGLPCPADVLVRRLAEGPEARGMIIRLRRLQGRCRRGLSALRKWR